MNNGNFNSSRPKRPRTSMISVEDDTIDGQLELLKAENAKLKDDSQLKDAAIAKLVVKNNVLKSRLPNYNVANENMDSETDRMKEIKAELEVSKRNAQKALDDSEKKIQDMKNEYKEKIEELKEKLKEADHRCNELKQKENEANIEIENQRKKIQDLEYQLRQATMSHDNASEDVIAINEITRETEYRYLSVEEIHNGTEILYDRLDNRTVNVAKIETEEPKFWKLYSTETSEPFVIDAAEVFKRKQFKINVTGTFVCRDESVNTRIKEIIPWLSCNHTSIKLHRQNLDEYEFLKLVSKVKVATFDRVSVQKKFQIDEILKKLPDIEDFEYHFHTTIGEMAKDPAILLAKLPRFDKLKKFTLCNCINTFGLEKFSEFINKHDNVEFAVHYRKYSKSIQSKIKQREETIKSNMPSSVTFQIKFP